MDLEVDNSFIPKQARIKNEDFYGELATSFTKVFIERALDFIPPLVDSSVIHDNGCGTGVVTQSILSRPSTGKVTIKANDLMQGYVDFYSAELKANQWPAEVSLMPAEKLSFVDNTFDLSVANFVLFMTADDGVPALREMYRVLKQGGAAVFTAWQYFPAMSGIERANDETRGDDGAKIRSLPEDWKKPSFLASRAELGGFDQDKITVHTLQQQVPVGDLGSFARTSWSWLGRPEEGWCSDDEENWESAVAVIEQEWKKSPGFEQLDDGSWVMNCTACVAIAIK
ncbi:S-adenosyl-L-methionine-dependent methyltransferase [Xylaria bambusicola]|uniref:S-adenosyl-L-methionine-dependent methyltransferase n=1 Tax=Xylaria bambusicola TaxID=326684 RepID=UPI002008D3AD|nr:S-adenosyl-L-methionine-dependent methyltransferase [Xylaria bambusicola]KAI0517002.1 S-adenosyl-L-methionine-dependent methyltransferase [Xylaria bambusicola]